MFGSHDHVRSSEPSFRVIAEPAACGPDTGRSASPTRDIDRRPATSIELRRNGPRPDARGGADGRGRRWLVVPAVDGRPALRKSTCRRAAACGVVEAADAERAELPMACATIGWVAAAVLCITMSTGLDHPSCTADPDGPPWIVTTVVDRHDRVGSDGGRSPFAPPWSTRGLFFGRFLGLALA